MASFLYCRLLKNTSSSFCESRWNSTGNTRSVKLLYMYTCRFVLFGTAEVRRQRTNITTQIERMQKKYTSIKPYIYIVCLYLSIKFAAEMAVFLSLSVLHVVLFSEHTDIIQHTISSVKRSPIVNQFYFCVNVKKVPKVFVNTSFI
jgi:hypothetical protein